MNRRFGRTVRTVTASFLAAATLPRAAPGIKAGGFDNTDIARRSMTEVRQAASVSDAQAKAWTADTLCLFPDVGRGDRIMGVNHPGTGVLFFVNGKAGGEIRDPVFARLFFGIWLSDKTPEPQLCDALLAGAV